MSTRKTAKQKVAHWSGANKRKVRSLKKKYIKQAIEEGFIRNSPNMLSFAGAKAIFEHSLIKDGLVSSEDIVTIQDCKMSSNGYPSEKILKSLIKERDSSIEGMFIWPSTFNSFVNCYKGDKVSIPNLQGLTSAKWYTNEEFRECMLDFVDAPVIPFNILDIDMCGPWLPNTGEDIATLMRNKGLDSYGIMFINHLKGRDIKGGKTFEYLLKYFKDRPWINLDEIKNPQGHKIDLTDKHDNYTKYCFRNILYPLFYITEAFLAGYHLDITALIEYSDRNVDGIAGTTMLQWVMHFEPTSQSLMGQKTKGLLPLYSKAIFSDHKRYLKNMKKVMNQTYKYVEYEKDSTDGE